MTARWHLGAIEGAYFWWVLVSSPELLVFLFFMITDPKTIPTGRGARRGYAVGVGLLAALLIAPQRTEYGSKVALLVALALVCATRPLLERYGSVSARLVGAARARLRATAFAGAVGFVGLLLLAGIPARSSADAASAASGDAGRLPQVTILPSKGVAGRIGEREARRIARDVVDALGPGHRVARMQLALAPGEGQGPPTVVATLEGNRFRRTVELSLERGRYVILPEARTQAAVPASRGFDGVRLTDVAARVGLNFRHGAFRFGVTQDQPAMMGGGLCWLDYDNDGWLDLFVVNSFADAEIPQWQERGGLPRSALFHNVRGRFVDVSARSGAGLAVRGNGCVAADLNGDGHTDLYVTTAVSDVLLWNDGDETFTEGARASGVVSFGWHSGAAAGDVNGDGRVDLFVAGYTDVHAPVRGSAAGFPTNHEGVRDLLFLNVGNRKFREVGVQAGLESSRFEHGLGAVLSDLDGDGRLDLYLANDEDPNRLYVNVPAAGELGFRFEERGRSLGVADRNAGMGIANADFSGDGWPDLFVTNSRRQRHAAFRNEGRTFADARPAFAGALDTSYTGWGASWVDLDLDGNLDLVLANGAIPVKNLSKDAEPIRVLENLGAHFADVGRIVGLSGTLVNGRGLAAADFDNDGDLDVAINSIGGRLMLLRNAGATGRWLEVKLTRFAPGTLVTVLLPNGRKLVREVQAGSSYLSSEDPRIHFGLGTATTVRELRVRYPGGAESRLTNVAADRILTVR
jgi:hypothetical protein